MNVHISHWCELSVEGQSVLPEQTHAIPYSIRSCFYSRFVTTVEHELSTPLRATFFGMSPTDDGKPRVLLLGIIEQ